MHHERAYKHLYTIISGTTTELHEDPRLVCDNGLKRPEEPGVSQMFTSSFVCPFREAVSVYF